ncbi:alkaline phosphatase [Lentisphaerota bacterium WC36G]|nr:alkaline phosphatase [Lentisphaerae bacterium WC36]
MNLFAQSKIKLTSLVLSSLLLIVGLTSASSYAAPANNKTANKSVAKNKKSVKYVFLMIGDGMAATQINVTRKYKEKPLNIDKLNVKGLTYTGSQNKSVTDSAAAATAIACGKKTANGMVGVSAQGEKLVSIAEKAKKYSKRKVGIVSSVSLNHATPAAFYAKNTNRGEYYEIGLDLVKSDIDFYGGGGLNEKSGDKGDLYELAKKRGFKFVDSKKDFEKLKNGEKKKILAIAPRLNDDASMPKSIDQREGDISLAQFTQKAIDVLDNDNGFLIVVEGGQIDWSCHENDGATVIKELLAFDEAVKVAYDFAQKHPEETLIVVGGDHETGGMKMGLSGSQYRTYRSVLSKQKNSAKVFNAEFDKKASSFKYSEDKKVMGQQFNEMMKLVKNVFGTDFTISEKNQIKKGFYAFLDKKAKDPKLKNKYGNMKFGKYNPVTVAVLHTLNKRAGVSWTSFEHTATPTTVFAYGKKADIFAGSYQNTELGIKLMSVIGVPARVEYK